MRGLRYHIVRCLDPVELREISPWEIRHWNFILLGCAVSQKDWPHFFPLPPLPVSSWHGAIFTLISSHQALAVIPGPTDNPGRLLADDPHSPWTAGLTHWVCLSRRQAIISWRKTKLCAHCWSWKSLLSSRHQSEINVFVLDQIRKWKKKKRKCGLNPLGKFSKIFRTISSFFQETWFKKNLFLTWNIILAVLEATGFLKCLLRNAVLTTTNFSSLGFWKTVKSLIIS